MNAIDPVATLAELVNLHPQLAREFESRGLDYCCGGAQSFSDACIEQGLDPESLASELAGSATDGGPGEWSTMGATELVDHLERVHHQFLWTELPRLSALVEKILGVHGEGHPELAEVASCFAEIRADLEPHLLKEEQMLFPMIRELESTTGSVRFDGDALRDPVSVMLSEHDTLGDLLARLRHVTGGYEPPTDGCASYEACFAGLAELEADTHLHIHKENNLLFPMVARLENGLQR